MAVSTGWHPLRYMRLSIKKNSRLFFDSCFKNYLSVYLIYFPRIFLCFCIGFRNSPAGIKVHTHYISAEILTQSTFTITLFLFLFPIVILRQYRHSDALLQY